MSYNTDLQTNNTSLQEILATINSLPEAGESSGGGTEIETCTVSLDLISSRMIYYLALENGNIVIKNTTNTYDSLENVIVGSILVYCVTCGGIEFFANAGSISPIYSYNVGADQYATYIYQIPVNGGIIRSIAM